MGLDRRTLSPTAAMLATFAIILSACGGGATPAPSISTPGASGGEASASAVAAASLAPCGTVNIAVNPWVGYEADAAVVGYLLQQKLGCTVVDKNLTEQVSWQGFGTGQVDVVLENWGHPELVAKYITQQHVAQDFGQTGNKGI